MKSPVTVRISSNPKLQRQRMVPTGGKDRPVPVDGRVVATSIPIQQTCPESCPRKRTGSCYALSGRQKFHNEAREAAALELGLTADQLIAAELDALRKEFPDPTGLALRFHDGGGDVTTVEQANKLAEFTNRWLRSGGRPVWTYTHAARWLPRAAFGRLSALGSCDFVADIRQVTRMGYAPAVVVPAFPADRRRFTVPGTGWSLIPCPAETEAERTCDECRLCWNDAALRERRVGIAFREHGNVGLVRLRTRARGTGAGR